MKAEEYIDSYRKLSWLQGIIRDYREHIALMEKHGDDFVVQGIGYSARGEGVIHFNSHRSIQPGFILDALKDALQRVEQEYEDLKRDLERVEVELLHRQSRGQMNSIPMTGHSVVVLPPLPGMHISRDARRQRKSFWNGRIICVNCIRFTFCR